MILAAPEIKVIGLQHDTKALAAVTPHSQEVKPYQFGHPYTKKTRLWLSRTVGKKTIKKSEMYKKTIIDVVCASGGEITEGRFELLLMLLDEYAGAVRCEKWDEERATEMEAAIGHG